MRRTLTIMVTAAIAVAAACGGDDLDDTPAAPAGQSGADSGDGESTDADDFVLPEVSDDGDITTQILAKVFGLPPSYMTDEGRACVSAELAPLFPDGVVPDDVQLTEELSTALNDAADICQVDFQG